MSTTEILNVSHNVACQAFALCDRPAVGASTHPVLGFYLSCARCAERLEKELLPVEVERDADGARS